MHVVELSYMYPSPRHPTSGVFIERQVREMARRAAVDVVSPVPWVPPGLAGVSARWRSYAAQPATSACHGVRVHHPRYLQPIGRWAVPVAGAAMGLAALPVCRALAAARGADVIHAHQLLPEGVAAVMIGRRLGRPVVCTLHGDDATLAPFHDRAARAAARWVLRHVRALTAVSPNLLESVGRLSPLAVPAEVVPNGVDLDRFLPYDRRAARARLGLEPDGAIVVYAGLLIPRKGLDVLLDAFAPLASTMPHARLVLIGGSAERDDQRRELVRAATLLGCADRVRFVGRRPHDEMPLWFAAADVCALPSRREGFPNVVREALACGTPCVATALPGMAETVGAGGLVVPPDDPVALRDALATAFRAGWDRAALRRRAAAWRWEASADAMLAVLRRAAGRSEREVA